MDDNPGVGEYASLAFNNYGRPFISYYDAVQGTLKLAYRIGSGGTGCVSNDSWECITIDNPPLDAVIDPAQTRPILVKALNVLMDKMEDRPRKKHGVPPV